jgi:hypothetical protein
MFVTINIVEPSVWIQNRKTYLAELHRKVLQRRICERAHCSSCSHNHSGKGAVLLLQLRHRAHLFGHTGM